MSFVGNQRTGASYRYGFHILLKRYFQWFSEGMLKNWILYTQVMKKATAKKGARTYEGAWDVAKQVYRCFRILFLSSIPYLQFYTLQIPHSIFSGSFCLWEFSDKNLWCLLYAGNQFYIFLLVLLLKVDKYSGCILMWEIY